MSKRPDSVYFDTRGGIQYDNLGRGVPPIPYQNCQCEVIRGDREPYVSVDIETTGIDHDYCQVIEIGAVIDNWVTPLDQLPRFHCYVVHDRIVGEPFALAMNAEILRRIANRNKKENEAYTFLTPEYVAPLFQEWLDWNGYGRGQAFTPAGKNFSGFDRQFLKKLPDFECVKIVHRAIDPAMMFWNPDKDKEPPSSKTCMERSAIDGEVAHTALEDALAIIKMVRYRYPPVGIVPYEVVIE